MVYTLMHFPPFAPPGFPAGAARPCPPCGILPENEAQVSPIRLPFLRKGVAKASPRSPAKAAPGRPRPSLSNRRQPQKSGQPIYSRCHLTPCGVSSSTMPRALSSSRIRSASAKSLFFAGGGALGDRDSQSRHPARRPSRTYSSPSTPHSSSNSVSACLAHRRSRGHCGAAAVLMSPRELKQRRPGRRRCSDRRPSPAINCCLARLASASAFRRVAVEPLGGGAADCAKSSAVPAVVQPFQRRVPPARGYRRCS